MERHDLGGHQAASSRAAIAELNAISSASPTSGFAVGDYSNGDLDTLDLHSLSLRWNGTKWTTVASPRRPRPPRSCSGRVPTRRGRASGMRRPAPARWSSAGTAPSGRSSPRRSRGQLGRGSERHSVHSATNCFVVGSSFSGPADDTPLVERWNGTALSVVPEPGAGGRDRPASKQSRAPARRLQYRGRVDRSRSDRSVLRSRRAAQRALGTARPGRSSRPRERTVHPAGRRGLRSATRCFAVGTRGWSRSGTARRGRLRFSGKKSSQSILTSVACPHRESVLRGRRVQSNDGFKVLIEHFDGTSWTIAECRSPPARPTSALFSISCTSVNDCTAVGLYQQDASTNPT